MGRISATTWQIGIAFLWAIVLVAAFVTTTPRPWALTIVGMGLGCLSGHIRSRALGEGKPARTVHVLAWPCGIGLMILAMAVAEDMFIGAWAASFAAYLLLDRVYSLPASCRKRQAPTGVSADGS